MTKGILIYAHNNRTVDYALMALISGGLAKKNLRCPVSLVTDQTTVDWMMESDIYHRAETIFEHIFIVDRPGSNNMRSLYDGVGSSSVVQFINTNRYSAYDITPYDRTLLIDADFLVLSNRLGEYWDVDCDVLIGDSINDIYDQQRLGYQDRYVSDVGIKLYWATTVMFTKNIYSKMFFDLVRHIRNYYQYYADTYRFDARTYRNDIAFSVAKHVLEGFEQTDIGSLPAVLTLQDRDMLHSVNDDKLTVLVSPKMDYNYCAATVHNIDLHVMNKQSLIRNSAKLLELI
jgi:hypothetical protein